MGGSARVARELREAAAHQEGAGRRSSLGSDREWLRECPIVYSGDEMGKCRGQ